MVVLLCGNPKQRSNTNFDIQTAIRTSASNRSCRKDNHARPEAITPDGTSAHPYQHLLNKYITTTLQVFEPRSVAKMVVSHVTQHPAAKSASRILVCSRYLSMKLSIDIGAASVQGE